MYKYIEVKDRESEEVIKRLDVTDVLAWKLERIESGIEINMNHDKYYISIANVENKLELIK